ncbi:beta-ketoacyl-[acyl-carrier-protein] synthase family protein [Streptomyces sp. NPDC018031]|uniref:beta-ketoacyl-[acyl-carrier-protein] synthase family protein n=1 Tax=Streptomyces sp. NPDC018031 TaxID=3365033 RepID=UPI00379A9CAF
MDDVLITGLGTVSCLGSGIDAYWRGLNAARSAPGPIPVPDANMPYPSMYLVPEADLPDGPPEQDGLPIGRGSRLALEAARQAVADAGADSLAALDPRRIAVSISTGMGDADLHEGWRPGGPPDTDRWAPAFPVAAVVGGRLGAEGGNTSISNACSASGYALTVAADQIRAGEADVVVVGGAEACSRVALACFNRLGAMDPERCRPFAADRRGTHFGEGAAVLVLESAAHARRRGAGTVYAALAGSGWSCDAYHATAPEPTGAEIEHGMRQALAEAGAGPEEVAFVVPHGTGTELNDVVESEVLGTVLGDRAAGTPVYNLKALIGHTGSAAGAFGALTSALLLHHGRVPGNVDIGERDPRCAVSLPTAGAPTRGRFGLVNAYAFGGNNISLVLQEARL